MKQYLANTTLGNVNVNDYTATMGNTLQTSATGWQLYPTYEEFNQLRNELQETKKSSLNPTKNTKKEIKMAIGKNKRGLFQVILVDPKKKEMIMNTLVIADTVEDVLLEVDAGKIIKEKGLQVSEVDKIVNILGEIRKTRKSKDTGELEIITEEIKE
jgi:hypothetical protein